MHTMHAEIAHSSSVISIGVWMASVNMLLQVGHIGHGVEAKGAGECQLQWIGWANTMHTAHVTPKVILAADDHIADLAGEALPVGHMNQLVTP